jgi:hypothetical protein
MNDLYFCGGGAGIIAAERSDLSVASLQAASDYSMPAKEHHRSFENSKRGSSDVRLLPLLTTTNSDD